MATRSLRDTLESFAWLHPPARWTIDSALELTSLPDTDYWQRTHYGFQRDTGHFLHTTIDGDFGVTAALSFDPTAQYDQCGLMCRVDSQQWIKCSVEYETPEWSRLGSVVTNHGYSDWATQDVSTTITRMHYRINRRGSDFLLAWSDDGSAWHQMRIAHLHECPAVIQVGFYACSPTGPGFTCRVHDLTIAPNDWSAYP